MQTSWPVKKTHTHIHTDEAGKVKITETNKIKKVE